MKRFEATAKLFAYVRKQLKFSMAEMANRMHSSKSTVWRYEQGVRQPGHKALSALVAVSGCTSMTELARKAFQNVPLKNS